MGETRTRVELLEDVARCAADVRTWQRRYYGGDKSPSTLQASKVAERRLDHALAALSSPQAKLPLGGAR